MNPKKEIDKTTLAGYLDFANHHQDSTPDQIRELCHKVRQFGFHAAFVNPYFIKLAREALRGKGVVGTVIAFPLGQETTSAKIFAAKEAIGNGAEELDVVMNVGMFKARQKEAVLEEMRLIVASAKETKKEAVVKFIIETGLLTLEEIKAASELVLASGADFVKTSSGWGPRGATVQDVQLIREAVGQKIKIKVAGGVDTYQEAMAFIGASVDRIGTSHAVEILEEIELPRPVQGGE